MLGFFSFVAYLAIVVLAIVVAALVVAVIRSRSR
jgi:hypothetical protein